MPCPLCGHPKSHKHGCTSKGSQRFYGPNCTQTFTDTFDAIYYRRQLTPQEGHTILQFHTPGRWHRRQNKFGKFWKQRAVTVR